MKKIFVCFVFIITVVRFADTQEVGWFEFENWDIKNLEYKLWESGSLFPSSVSMYDIIDVQYAIQELTGSTSNLQTPVGFLWSIKPAVIPAMYLASTFDGAFINNGSWLSRVPFISIPITFSYDSWIMGKTVFDIREDHNTIEFPGAPQNISNIPNGPEYIDFTAPFEAWIGISSAPFSMLVGRAKTRMGNGITGSLILSDNADFYDQIRLQFKLPNVSYTVLLIEMYPLVLDAELANKVTTWEKAVVYHRFEFLLWRRLSIALTEAIMIGGMSVPLSALNPFMVFHDLFLWNSAPQLSQGFMPASSFLGVELRVNPWKYMELYASFAMNQVQTDFEKSYYGATTIPDAFGVLCGVRTAVPLEFGWLTGTIEFVYTNPWLYIRENELNSYFWHRQLTSNYPNAIQYATMPLGYPEGPDAIVWYASIGINNPDVYLAALSFSYIVKGEQGAFTRYEESSAAASLRTPTGIPQHQTMFGIDLEWRATTSFSVFAGLCYLYYNNYMHQLDLVHQQVNITLGIKLGFIYESQH